MRITTLVTMLLVASLFLANGQPSNAVAEAATLNAEREKFLRTLQQVRENFKSADEDANAETDFAMSKQIKRMRAYQRAFSRVDLDRDGTLSWEEYLSVLRSREGRN